MGECLNYSTIDTIRQGVAIKPTREAQSMGKQPKALLDCTNLIDV